MQGEGVEITMNPRCLILSACLCGGICVAFADDEKMKLPDLVYRSNGVYSVIEAAEVGDTAVVEARIKEGCNVNQKDENGYTALHMAAIKGSAKCVKLLLEAGADSLLTDADGKTARKLSKSKKVNSLLDKAMKSRQMEIELCSKVVAGEMDALKKAIKSKGFNANMMNADNTISLLMLVCAHGDVASVKSLIKAGADVNYVAPDSRSVLHKAVDRENADIINALLEAGANPMAQAGNKATALHDAVWNAKETSIKALLPAYKDINYSPAGGFNGTPINLAIDRNFSNVVQLFIDAGIDLNKNDTGELPLVHAAIAGKSECIEVLLKAGASKTARDKNGKTAGEAAAESVRYLF